MFMRRRRPDHPEAGLTLYQLLISLVLLVITLSLASAYQLGRQSRPVYGALEAPTKPR